MDSTSLYSIKGLAILDQEGNRILAKYYGCNTLNTIKEQRAFEKSLFMKTSKANAEIILLDGLICVSRSNVDLFFYVMGSLDENELILVAVLNCLFDSFSLLLRKNVEKKALVENMDIAMLIIDEICDNGIFLETEPQAVINRCALRADDLVFGDQSISQVGMSVHMPRSKVELKDTGSKNLEQFQDQVDCSCALFAVDNYFKNKSKNRSKNLDWKSGENFKICDRNDALKCDLDNLQHCLANIDNFLPDQMKKDCLKISEDFEKWFSYLAAGFNLLMYGVGSKNSLMKEFCNDQLGECTFLTVNGFMPSVNAWTILKALYLHLSLKIPSKGNGFMGFVKGISGELERRNEDVVLVINNIDGPGLRSDLDKRALVHLARCSKIHIVASANLFNSSVLWNQTMCVGLNFLWINVNTWKCYREEFTALESRLLGHRSDHSGSSHTIDTLNAIWRSLTTNSQMILHLIAKYFYSTGMPLEFFDLFRRARDEFFVSAETALRYQLNEFYDHRLIDRYQHRDGIVYISMIVDKKVMIEFFNGIGVKMDQEQLSE